MIHPFAQFSAIPAAGETLAERAALLERPAIEFAEFLKASQGATPAAAASSMAAPQKAALGIAQPLSQPGLPQSALAQPVSSQLGSAEPPSQALPASNAAAAGEALSAGTATPGADAETAGGPLHFPDLPDSAKYPAGPYRQAPPEFGGEWWLVNPFTGDEPWRTQAAPGAGSVSKYAAESLPADFRQAFGEMPVRRAGENGVDFAGRLSRWKQDLEFFQRTGIPDGFDESQVELASAVYEQWGMGQPVFYEGRYGWFARFPDSAIPEFEMDAASTVQASHLAIARYQVRLIREGAEPPVTHPFVPPHLLTKDT